MSHHPLTHLAACVALAALAMPSLANAQSSPAPAPAPSATSASITSASSTDATNTRLNKRDRSMESTTPIDQPNDSTDIKLAAAVREAIVQDDALSVHAHNVKLVAANGVVTLRGPVTSADEKTAVAAKVAAVPGVTRVDNQLDVQH